MNINFSFAFVAPVPAALGRAYGALRLQPPLLGHQGCSVCRWASLCAGPPAAGWAAPPSARRTAARPAFPGTGCWPAQSLLLDDQKRSSHISFFHIDVKGWLSLWKGRCSVERALTQVAIDDFAVVHLTSHCANLLELRLLALHAFLQPLQLLALGDGLLLTTLLLLQVTQTLLLHRTNINILWGITKILNIYMLSGLANFR